MQVLPQVGWWVVGFDPLGHSHDLVRCWSCPSPNLSKKLIMQGFLFESSHSDIPMSIEGGIVFLHLGWVNIMQDGWSGLQYHLVSCRGFLPAFPSRLLALRLNRCSWPSG